MLVSRLALIAAGVLWSLGGVFIKALSGGIEGVQPLSASGIVFYRSLFAALALAVFLPRLWRTASPNPDPNPNPDSNRVFCARSLTRDLLISIGLFAALLALYVASTQGTTAANAIFLQYTAPVYVILLSPLLLKEPRRRSDVITLLIAGLGIATILLGSSAGSPSDAAARSNSPVPPLSHSPIHPIVLGLASGLFFGLFLLWLRRLRGLDPLSLTAWNNLGVAFVFLVVLLCTHRGDLSLPAHSIGYPAAAISLGVLAAMGILQIAAPYVLFSYGLRRISGVEASLLTLIEPVLNPVWVVLLIGERPSTPTLAGGGMILLALLLRYTCFRERDQDQDQD